MPLLACVLLLVGLGLDPVQADDCDFPTVPGDRVRVVHSATSSWETLCKREPPRALPPGE